MLDAGVHFEAATPSFAGFQIVLHSAKQGLELVEVGTGRAFCNLLGCANLRAGLYVGKFCDVVFGRFKDAEFGK